MDAGVAQVSEVCVKVRALYSIRDRIIGCAVHVEEHRGQQDQRVDGESPDEHPEHVHVGNDTEAELGEWVRRYDGSIDWVLLRFHLLLDDFLSIDLYCLILDRTVPLSVVI